MKKFVVLLPYDSSIHLRINKLNLIDKPLIVYTIKKLLENNYDVAVSNSDQLKSFLTTDEQKKIKDISYLKRENIKEILYLRDDLFIENLVLNETDTNCSYLKNNDLIAIKRDYQEEYISKDLNNIFKNHSSSQTFLSSQNEISVIKNLIDFQSLEMRLQHQINLKHLYNGVLIHNIDNSSISVDAYIEPGVIIENNVQILGHSFIEKGTFIGSNSIISNCKIGKNNRILSSVISDSTLGDNNQIGPFAHLRQHCIIKDNTRIGNYVEIKNSIINNGTKISHLTYIGDTTCGSNVNFGCGTVIVNYDGEKKHHTQIGDNVFIGCNSNLIAPIKIGNNSFIAAGSTITDNMDKESFAIARSKQITKENYARKYSYFKKFGGD